MTLCGCLLFSGHSVFIGVRFDDGGASVADIGSVAGDIIAMPVTSKIFTTFCAVESPGPTPESRALKKQMF
jgi:hypothetical protein